MSIRTSTHNGVLSIEIARPEKKNALTETMYEAMTAALRAAGADDRVRAVLITGQPDVFTSGNDLKEFLAHPPTMGEDSPVLRFMHALIDTEKPVVAAVTGMAVGIGVTMLLHCDLVYVSDAATLVMPFVGLGLVPEFGSSLLLPMLMGHRRAAEKLLLGEPFTASAAVECGLANEALPAVDVLRHARRMAERFNELPAGAVRDTKRLMGNTLRDRLLRQLRVESDLFATRLHGPEAKEALAAFFAKRKPDFSTH